MGPNARSYYDVYGKLRREACSENHLKSFCNQHPHISQHCLYSSCAEVPSLHQSQLNGWNLQYSRWSGWNWIRKHESKEKSLKSDKCIPSDDRCVSSRRRKRRTRKRYKNCFQIFCGCCRRVIRYPRRKSKRDERKSCNTECKTVKVCEPIKQRNRPKIINTVYGPNYKKDQFQCYTSSDESYVSSHILSSRTEKCFKVYNIPSSFGVNCCHCCHYCYAKEQNEKKDIPKMSCACQTVEIKTKKKYPSNKRQCYCNHHLSAYPVCCCMLYNCCCRCKCIKSRSETNMKHQKNVECLYQSKSTQCLNFEPKLNFNDRQPLELTQNLDPLIMPSEFMKYKNNEHMKIIGEVCDVLLNHNRKCNYLEKRNKRWTLENKDSGSSLPYDGYKDKMQFSTVKTGDAINKDEATTTDPSHNQEVYGFSNLDFKWRRSLEEESILNILKQGTSEKMSFSSTVDPEFNYIPEVQIEESYIRPEIALKRQSEKTNFHVYSVSHTLPQDSSFINKVNNEKSVFSTRNINQNKSHRKNVLQKLKRLKHKL